MTAYGALSAPINPGAADEPPPGYAGPLGPPSAAERRDGLVPGERYLGLQRQCTVCGECYPLDDEFFYRQPAARGGFETRCRACHREQNNAWAADARARARSIRRSAMTAAVGA